MADVYLDKTFGIESNCYLLVCGDEAAVIDPSVSLDRFSDIGNVSITKVLLTHGHFDHILALSDYISMGVDIYVAKEDEKMLKDASLNASALFGHDGISFDVPVVNVCDGDVISLGGEQIKVIATPGHTEGSVCYSVENNF